MQSNARQLLAARCGRSDCGGGFYGLQVFKETVPHKSLDRLPDGLRRNFRQDNHARLGNIGPTVSGFHFQILAKANGIVEEDLVTATVCKFDDDIAQIATPRRLKLALGIVIGGKVNLEAYYYRGQRDFTCYHPCG